MKDTAELLKQLRAARRETVRRIAGVDEAGLQAARTWRGQTTTLIHRLQWLAEGDETRVARIQQTRTRLGAPLSAAQVALVQGGQTRGALLGTLVGVEDDLLERPPAPGEWSVRQTLGHVIATDRRYQIAVEYALERARTGRGGPLRPPDAMLPPRTGEAESEGTLGAVYQRLTVTRDDLVRSLATTPDALLDAPTNWLLWDLDVRFRLHRFAAHDREHTIQIRKTLRALGVAQSEAQLLLADAAVARGALEAVLLCTRPDLLEQEPPDGGPSIAAEAAASIDDERDL